MTRWFLVTCVILMTVVGTGRADDPRGGRLGQPVALTPYAPASAYLPATAFDPAVKPAGGATTYIPPIPTPAATSQPVAAKQPGTTVPPPPTMPGNAAPVYSDGGAACDPISRLKCDACGPEEHGWVRADYLLWSVSSGTTPPLVASDPPGTARAAVGAPGAPGQRILAGGSGFNSDLRSGFRVSAGYWIDPARQWGVSGDFFFLGSQYDNQGFSSPGDPPLSRPFFNAATGLPDAELVAYPGVLSGAVGVRSRTSFVGAGGFIQRNICCDYDATDPCSVCGYRLDFLFGYRHFNLDDTLRVREDLLVGGQALVPPGTRIVVTDRFRTENAFDGALLGLAGDARWGRWTVDFRGGVSLGNLHRTLAIDGSTAVSVPGLPPGVRSGGLLAQPSNIGRYTSNEFTAAPEIGVNLGYQLTPSLRVHVGYTFIYLPNTWRAGDQIDRTVNPTQLSGVPGARPVPQFVSTGAAVQGLNVGLTFRY